MIHLIPVRVLLIDDDDNVCRKVGAWLTEAAYDVVPFTAAGPALEYAGRVFAPLALVDLRLPETDAPALITELRRVSPRTEVIVMAAFPEVSHVIAAVRAGARDILEKPIQRPGVLAALERLLVQMGVAVRTEEEYNQRLGALLREARTAARRTLNDVATASGVSPAQLSQIETGKTGTSTWTFARVCAALQTRPSTLLEGL